MCHFSSNGILNGGKLIFVSGCFITSWYAKTVSERLCKESIYLKKKTIIVISYHTERTSFPKKNTQKNKQNFIVILGLHA